MPVKQRTIKFSENNLVQYIIVFWRKRVFQVSIDEKGVTKEVDLNLEGWIQVEQTRMGRMGEQELGQGWR